MESNTDRRRSAFEKVRDEACETLKKISRLYAKSSEDPEGSLNYKYTLRGVSTSLNTIYVLEKSQPEDEDDTLSSDAKDWQWWKLGYLYDDLKPVICTKIAEEDVVKAASTDSRSALLVYASERAVTYRSRDLPLQLRNFVRADNLSFNSELEGMSPLKPATPTKRKADDGNHSGLQTHFHRSPSYDRNSHDNPKPEQGYDSKPRTYHPNPLPPALPSRRPVSRKAKSSDIDESTILDNLGTTESIIHPNCMVIDQDETGDYMQEMQERGKSSLLYHQNNSRTHCASASYVSEVDMVGQEVGEDQRRARPGKHDID